MISYVHPIMADLSDGDPGWPSIAWASNGSSTHTRTESRERIRCGPEGYKDAVGPSNLYKKSDRPNRTFIYNKACNLTPLTSHTPASLLFTAPAGAGGPSNPIDTHYGKDGTQRLWGQDT